MRGACLSLAVQWAVKFWPRDGLLVAALAALLAQEAAPPRWPAQARARARRSVMSPAVRWEASPRWPARLLRAASRADGTAHGRPARAEAGPQAYPSPADACARAASPAEQLAARPAASASTRRPGWAAAPVARRAAAAGCAAEPGVERLPGPAAVRAPTNWQRGARGRGWRALRQAPLSSDQTGYQSYSRITFPINTHDEFSRRR